MPLTERDLTSFGKGGSQTRESMEAFIEEWKPLLGLHTWKIRVAWEKPIRGKHHAEIVVSDKLKTAVMTFHKNFTEWTDYWAETSVIHELLHCSHKAVDLAWEKATGITNIPGIDPALDPEAEWLVEDMYVTEMERFIDNLSCRLYELKHAATA